MGLREYLADRLRRKNEPDPRAIADAELLKAAKDVCRVALYQTMAIKALKIAVERVENSNGKN